MDSAPGTDRVQRTRSANYADTCSAHATDTCGSWTTEAVPVKPVLLCMSLPGGCGVMPAWDCKQNRYTLLGILTLFTGPFYGRAEVRIGNVRLYPTCPCHYGDCPCGFVLWEDGKTAGGTAEGCEAVNICISLPVQLHRPVQDWIWRQIVPFCQTHRFFDWILQFYLYDAFSGVIFDRCRLFLRRVRFSCSAQYL